MGRRKQQSPPLFGSEKQQLDIEIDLDEDADDHHETKSNKNKGKGKNKKNANNNTKTQSAAAATTTTTSAAAAAASTSTAAAAFTNLASGYARAATTPFVKNEDGSYRLIVVDGAGTRLDAYLTDYIKIPRSRTQRSIQEGGCFINGKLHTKRSYAVKRNDDIIFKPMDPPPMRVDPEPIALKIVHEDDHLIVIDKPPGMVVHPAPGLWSGTLVNALLHHFGSNSIEIQGDLVEEAAAEGEEGEESKNEEQDDDDDEEERGVTIIAGKGLGDIRPGIVHRIDKDTSGLLVVAKDAETHQGLKDQFSSRTVSRFYNAIVWGSMNDTGRIDTHMARDPTNRLRMAVTTQPGKGKRAVTDYRVMERYPSTCLVEYKLHTGRTHQIRVHSRHIGHTLFSDDVYGGRRVLEGSKTPRRKEFFDRVFTVLNRQALHAHTLGFIHPITKQFLNFVSPLPDDMINAIELLKHEQDLK